MSVYIVLMHCMEDSLSGQEGLQKWVWKPKKMSYSTYISWGKDSGNVNCFHSSYSVALHYWDFKWDWILLSDES